MPTSELDRLHDTLKSVFALISEIQKQTSSLEVKINGHLEVSDVRVRAYDQDIRSLKEKCIRLENELKLFNNFKIEHDAQNKGVALLKANVGWFIGLVASVFGVLAYFGVFKK